MGYTHYYEIKGKIQNGTMDDMVKSLKQVITKYGMIIQYESDNDREPEITEKEIRFNGIDDEGHETFSVDFINGKSDFCKTARKPYDLPVCECLLIIKSHFGNNFRLSSDGFGKELGGCWQKATDNVKAMGYKVDYEHSQSEKIIASVK